MSRLLVYTTPARGHLYPLVPTLDELKKRGHRIHIRTLASEIPLCQSRGYEAFALPPEVEAVEMDDYLGKSEAQRIQRAFEVFMCRAALDVPALQNAIDEVQPDGLLVDINSYGGQIVAERGSLPWAAYSPFLLPIPGKGIPPFGPGLAPMRGPIGCLRDFLVRKAVSGLLNKAGLKAYNQLRIEAGLQAVPSITEHPYATPPLLLAYTPQALDYGREYPPHVLSVGPGTWGPGDEDVASSQDDQRPAILVTTSSEYQGDELLARTAIEALANEAEEVFITTPAMDPACLNAPPSMQVARFINHAPLLSRASVVVTHGGMGSTQKALAAGAPVVVVPFGRDQLEVAQRVVRAKVGVALSPKKLSASQLLDAVKQARALKANAQAMAAAFQQAPGAKGAADAIEAQFKN